MYAASVRCWARPAPPTTTPRRWRRVSMRSSLNMPRAGPFRSLSRLPAPRVPVEGVLTQDPRLVIVPARDNDDVTLRRERWASYGLKAAIEGRVLGVDPDALFRPGPRLIDATEALCAAIDAARMDYP